MHLKLMLRSSDGQALNPDCSLFIRTSWMLDIKCPFSIPAVDAALRYISKEEALKLEDTTARRNVFSRHSYQPGFYLQRIREFANRSVIEVVRPGEPKEIAEDARRVASIVEAACVVSTALYASRKTLQASLGITPHRREVLDFTIGPAFRYLSASSRREATVRGVTVDKAFATRFKRLGLDVLVAQANEDTTLGRRLYQSLVWLFESRLEHSPDAALVKAAISYEALLGGSEGEPLRRTLSERAAFLLGNDPGSRSEIANAVKAFYDSRSRVVHGAIKRRVRGSPILQLEAAERILFLALIVLAANAQEFSSENALQDWVEQQRWGQHKVLRRPFRPGDLKRALQRAERS